MSAPGPIFVIDVDKLRALVAAGKLAPDDRALFTLALKEYDEIEANGSPAAIWVQDSKIVVGLMERIIRH